MNPRTQTSETNRDPAEVAATGTTTAGSVSTPAPPAEVAAADVESDLGANPAALWSGDTGVLGEKTRRVLLELLKGPYVSGAQNPQLWSALVADEISVRSRLHDLFLDLVIDKIDEFAFTRKVVTTEIEAPAAVRSERLGFLDTAMLLVLRQFLLAAPGERRVIVDREEVYERLAIYRNGDESTFLRNLNGAWSRMNNRLRVLHKAGEDRFEISPMVRFLIDEDQVRELIAVYDAIASGEDPGTTSAGDEDEDPGATSSGDEDEDPGTTSAGDDEDHTTQHDAADTEADA